MTDRGARLQPDSDRGVRLQPDSPIINAMSVDVEDYFQVSAFDRIVRDNSSYYVLAYYPAQNRRDGKFHRIQVRVSRPGVTVRARRGYIAPRVRSVSARATPGASASAAASDATSILPQVTTVTCAPARRTSLTPMGVR